jgi:lysyl-tRNA synthetase class 2
MAVAVLGVESVLSGLARSDPGRQRLFGHLTPPDLPSAGHVLVVLVGLAMLSLTPRLWRGTRTAVSLAIVGLGLLAALNIAKGDYDEALVEICLGLLLALGRGEFPVGCRNRPRLTIVCAAVGAWGLTYCAMLVAPLVPGSAGHELTAALHHSIGHALHSSASHRQLSADWSSALELMIGFAGVVSVLAIRSLLSPAGGGNGHAEHEYRAARGIVEQYGEDSLSPFVVRPDKALHFAAGGVLSYRMIGEIAIVSGDPVAPDGAAPEVVSSFLGLARKRGWQIALWGASARHLQAYRAQGLRTLCVGEEAFVNPQRFTLEGRSVRKLRQSVHRVERRGWEIVVREGRELDAALETEIDALEEAWRARQPRLLGFAMGMGSFDPDVRADDLYVLARSPEGELGAVMRFVAHCGKLSLDTMRRVGETPNGLNEALVCRALELARGRGVQEVSLNYAGLAHMVRGQPSHDHARRLMTRLVTTTLRQRFQMERLVCFNEKFSPEWRPRYLVYESRGSLPLTVMRVLQAEGYLPQGRKLTVAPRWRTLPRVVPRPPQAKRAG